MTLRALISGYYGYGNAGDEAVLAGMLQALKANGTEAVVISGNPAATKALHGVEAIGRGAWRTIGRELRRSDLLISGGGGLIQDRTSRRSALYYLGVIGWARALGVGAYLYAQGVGPIATGAVRAAARLVLPGVMGAGARDEPSAKALLDLGVPADRVNVTADAAFALPPVTQEEAERALRAARIPEGGPKVGLVWRPPAPRRRKAKGGVTGAGEGDALGRSVASALGRWTAEAGGSLVVMPMHPAYDAAESGFLARQAANAGARVHAVREVLDFRSIRAAISALDLVVSVRYHGLLFAAAGGVPCVGVAYDPKVAALAQTFGVEALPLSAGERDVREAVERAWARRDERRPRLLHRAEELRARALGEGARLRALLKGARAQ